MRVCTPDSARAAIAKPRAAFPAGMDLVQRDTREGDVEDAERDDHEAVRHDAEDQADEGEVVGLARLPGGYGEDDLRRSGHVVCADRCWWAD